MHHVWWSYVVYPWGARECPRSLLRRSWRLEQGSCLAGYRTVAACEIDPRRREVFAAQHPQCRMYADVRELTAELLKPAARVLAVPSGSASTLAGLS